MFLSKMRKLQNRKKYNLTIKKKYKQWEDFNFNTMLQLFIFLSL